MDEETVRSVEKFLADVDDVVTDAEIKAKVTALRKIDDKNSIKPERLAELLLVLDAPTASLRVSGKQMLVRLMKRDSTRIYFFTLTQRFTEIGLNCLISLLLRNGRPSGCSDKYLDALILMNLVAHTTASLEFCLRNQNILPCLFSRLVYDPPDVKDRCRYWTVINVQTFELLSCYVMIGENPSVCKELLEQYSVLNHMVTALKSVEMDKYCKDNVAYTAAYLVSLLAALGDDSSVKQIKSHECCYILLKYTPDPLGCGEYAKPRKKLCLALAGEETDEVTLEPYQRLAVRFRSQYFVFCTFDECKRFVRKEGILRRCAKCKLAQYCDRECQARHWESGHKQSCLGRKKNQI